MIPRCLYLPCPALPAVPLTHPLQLLQYHIVPSAALRASQLRDDQQLTTALAGATPLRVDLDDGRVEIKGRTDDNDADVVAADIVAGNAIVHVIDEVLIPPSLLRNTGRRDDDNDDDNDDDRDD